MKFVGVSTSPNNITFSQRLNVQFFPEGHPVFENPANRLTWHASCNPFMNSTKLKEKPKTDKKDYTEVCFFVSLIQNTGGIILQAPVCIPKSHKTRWLILSVVQALFEGGCSTKKAPAWKQWVQAGRKGCWSLQPAGCVSCVNRSSLYPIPLSIVQRPSCHRLFAPLCVLSRASPT